MNKVFHTRYTRRNGPVTGTSALPAPPDLGRSPPAISAGRVVWPEGRCARPAPLCACGRTQNRLFCDGACGLNAGASGGTRDQAETSDLLTVLGVLGW